MFCWLGIGCFAALDKAKQRMLGAQGERGKGSKKRKVSCGLLAFHLGSSSHVVWFSLSLIDVLMKEHIRMHAWRDVR